MRLKLEDRLVRSLGPGDYYDTLRRRLVLRVRPGSRRYVVRYRLPGGDPQRLTVGNADVLKLAEARERAKNLLADVDKGVDPRAVRQAERDARRQRQLGERVGKAIDSWLKDEKLGPAPRWKGGTEGATWAMPHVRRLKRTLGDKRLLDLTVKDLERFRSTPEAAATRNKALTVARLFLRWTRRKGLLEGDPTAGLTKEPEAERTRTLTDAELRALVRGFDSTRYGRAVRLLALTGLRRDEVLKARWDWLDLEHGVMVIPPEHEKSGKRRGEPRRVALSSAAVELLKDQRKALLREGLRASEYVFATSTGAAPHGDALKPIMYRLRGRRSNGLQPSKDRRAKKREAVLGEDATIHDLRRTVGDRLLNQLGTSPWIVDHVVLGHARPKLLRTYMPTLPLGEAREALARWANVLDAILAGEAAVR